MSRTEGYTTDAVIERQLHKAELGDLRAESLDDVVSKTEQSEGPIGAIFDKEGHYGSRPGSIGGDAPEISLAWDLRLDRQGQAPCARLAGHGDSGGMVGSLGLRPWPRSTASESRQLGEISSPNGHRRVLFD